MVTSARFILRQYKALRLKEGKTQRRKGIISSKRKLAGRQAQMTLLSNAKQWEVLHLRELGPGYQHSLLRLFKVLYQRVRMDQQIYRPFV